MAAAASAEARVGNGHFRLVRKFGGGSFGEVFKAVDIETKEVVAVKLEPRKSRIPQLIFEARLLKYLHHSGITVGLPRVRWYGTEGDYNILVMDLLGPSLEKLLAFCGKKFSTKSLCMLAVQMICRLEFLHAKGFIHRDIKPENFVMGTGKRAHHVYMIDFGLAKKYRDPKTLVHIPYREGKSLTGTARYVSLFTHLGMEQSRRDDLESLAYVLIYFARGSLPWQGFAGTTREEKYGKIAEKKMSLAPESLCRFLPPPLLEILRYAKQLDFEEQPNYEQCRHWFQLHLAAEGHVHDYQFDWSNQAEIERRSVSDAGSQVNSSRFVAVSGGSGGSGSAAHKAEDIDSSGG